MEYLIKKILKEYAEEEEKAFPKNVSLFFKFLNGYRKGGNVTLNDLGNFMLSNMKTFGLKPQEYQHYLNLYTQNFREDGQYILTKKNELNTEYNQSKPKRTSNSKASDLVRDLQPFKGSNLEGKWKQDYKGVWAYVVYSWNWYPIYMYKYKKWFEVDNRYSSSTGRHMSATSPGRYNSQLRKTMFIVSQDEMSNLLNGQETSENIIKNKNKKFIDVVGKEIDKFNQVRLGWDPRVRISFNFIKVSIEENDPRVDVEVINVDKMDNNKIDRSSGNFLKGEMVGVSKEYITNLMKEYISRYSSSILGRDVSNEISVIVTYLDNPNIN